MESYLIIAIVHCIIALERCNVLVANRPNYHYKNDNGHIQDKQQNAINPSLIYRQSKDVKMLLNTAPKSLIRQSGQLDNSPNARLLPCSTLDETNANSKPCISYGPYIVNTNLTKQHENLMKLEHHQEKEQTSIHNDKTLSLQDEIRSKSSMRDRIVNLTMAKYLSYERPPDGDNATKVTVNMKVLAIFAIDVRTMDYYIDLLLRQNWYDKRLSWAEIPEFQSYTEPLVSPKLKEQLWLPDLFFRNGKEGYLHKLTLPNYLLRVYPNGKVLYSQKITMRFSCQMHLQTFPMDSQRCHINIGSYGYTLNELKFLWRDKLAVELADKLQLSEFETPEAFDTHDCSDGYATSTGQYSCLNATFDLQRQLGSYLATTYVPNVLIIMVSWLSFWINVDSAPARIPLGLLSLLGILTQAISVTSTLPRVSYIKAIDIWMIFSIIFVIGVLIEYAVALTLLRHQQTETWHEDVKDIVREELARWCAICQQQQLEQLQNSQAISRGQMEFREELEYLLTNQVIENSKEKLKPRRPPGLIESEVDNYSRFLFPACFLLYNCFYWCYFLVIVNEI